MKKFLITSSLCALVLASCQPADTSDSGPIKIGFIGPLTGEAASYGVDTLNGTKLMIDEVNAAGGINGRQIQLIAEDGRCTGTDAASAAQKLVNIDKVVAILGGQCSGEVLAAAPIANAAGVVMIASVASSPDITDAGDFIFRDYPSDDLKTTATVNLFNDLETQKVALISENTDFAIAIHNGLQQEFGKDKFIMTEVVEPGTKDYRSLLTRLEGEDFDVLYANGQSTATIGTMTQQFREQGFTQKIISHEVALDKTLLDIAGESAEGMLAIAVPEVSDTTEFGSKFLQKYTEAQASLAFAAHAYDSAGILFDAIEAAGTGGSAIRDYLYAMAPYNGVVGNLSFDNNGDVLGVPFVLYEVKEGTWEPIQDIVVN